MLKKESKHRILILGASGFLGGAIYKELCSYFRTFGTYNISNKTLEKNKHFFQFNIEEDDVYEILDIVKPTIIISAIRGDFSEILEHVKSNEAIEVFPNLIMNVTTDSKITQQIHYIINRNKNGVFHLGSTDLVHHDDFIKEIINTLKLENKAIFKRVYTTNDDRYLAVLPKYNVLPKNLNLLCQLTMLAVLQTKILS